MDNSSDATRQNSVVGRERIHHGITNDIDYRDSSYFRHQRNSTSDDKSPLAWRDEDADHKARNAPQNDSQGSFERSALAPRTPPGSPPRSRPLSRASQRSLSRSSERGRSLSRNSSRTRNCSPGSQGYRSPRTLRDQPSNAQYSASRSDCSNSYEPESPTKFQNHPMTVSLQDRMKGGQKDSLSKRTHRICPFYHANSSDKHPPYKPHPGYQAGEFEEAVSIFAKQERLPKRLIKPGVVVNYRMQQDISSSTRSYSSGNNPERLQKGSRKRSHDHFTLESSNYGQHSKKRKFDTTQSRRNSYSIPGRAPTPPGGYGYPSDPNASQPANYRSNYRSTFNTSYPYYLENGAYHQRSYSDYQRQSPSSNW
ncbi:hypothetical protein FRC20_008299 [Serendipita sp. 405]|nr:hypothetical protein FRC15_008203 [Serendipita sp. 397]KAG8830700.1 hypothetical protein FRC20_008299 [Serendipita sp. 405]